MQVFQRRKKSGEGAGTPACRLEVVEHWNFLQVGEHILLVLHISGSLPVNTPLLILREWQLLSWLGWLANLQHSLHTIDPGQAVTLLFGFGVSSLANSIFPIGSGQNRVQKNFGENSIRHLANAVVMYNIPCSPHTGTLEFRLIHNRLYKFVNISLSLTYGLYLATVVCSHLVPFLLSL